MDSASAEPTDTEKPTSTLCSLKVPPASSRFHLALALPRRRHAAAPLIVFSPPSPGTCRRGLIIPADRWDLQVEGAGHASPALLGSNPAHRPTGPPAGAAGRVDPEKPLGAAQTGFLHPNSALNIRAGMILLGLKIS